MHVWVGWPGINWVPVVSEDFSVLGIEKGVFVSGCGDLPRPSVEVVGLHKVVALHDIQRDASPPESTVEVSRRPIWIERQRVSLFRRSFPTGPEGLIGNAAGGSVKREIERLDRFSRTVAGQKESGRQAAGCVGVLTGRRCLGIPQHPTVG